MDYCISCKRQMPKEHACGEDEYIDAIERGISKAENAFEPDA